MFPDTIPCYEKSVYCTFCPSRPIGNWLQVVADPGLGTFSKWVTQPSQACSKDQSAVHILKPGQITSGRMATPKRMNFRKSSKLPLTTPPLASMENHIALFYNFMLKKPRLKVQNIQ